MRQKNSRIYINLYFVVLDIFKDKWTGKYKHYLWVKTRDGGYTAYISGVEMLWFMVWSYLYQRRTGFSPINTLSYNKYLTTMFPFEMDWRWWHILGIWINRRLDWIFNKLDIRDNRKAYKKYKEGENG